jgi:single-strand DNA-binding protein
MANDINSVTLIGNLTKDPDLKETNSGKKVAELRLANNSTFKKGDEWVDRANYFQVTVWGKQGENAAQYLSKGSRVAIDGRLEWQSWDKPEGEGVNSRVVIVANNVQFLSTPKKQDASAEASSSSEGDDSDIPF